MIIGRLRSRKSSSCLAPALHCVIAAVLFASIAAPAMAQSGYPSRPIQIIVPFTPGGGNDLLARVLADKLTAPKA